MDKQMDLSRRAALGLTGGAAGLFLSGAASAADIIDAQNKGKRERKPGPNQAPKRPETPEGKQLELLNRLLRYI